MARVAKSGRVSVSGTVTVSGRSALPATQNLLTFSNDFTNIAWATSFGGSTSASAIANPIDGTVNASSFTEDTSTGGHIVAQSVSSALVPAGSNQSLSVFVKAGGRIWVGVAPSNGSAISYFNLSNGTIGTQSNSTAKIKDYGNGWYLCTTFCPKVASQDQFRVYAASANGTVSFTGNGTLSFYLYAPQATRANWPGPLTITTGSNVNTGTIRNLVAYT